MKQKRILVALLLGICPFLVLTLKSLLLGVNIFNNHPVWTDELLYWRELFSIGGKGTAFGYTEGWLGVDYAPKLWNLGCHGIAPVLAWGWYAVLFGIRDNSLMIANIVMVAIALGLLGILVRPSWAQTLGLLLLVFTYVPLVSYIQSSMMELPCYAAVIMVIALLLCYERSGTKQSIWGLSLAIMYCSMLRICYAIFFVPMVLLSFKRHHSWRKLVAQTGSVLIGVGVMRYIQNLFTSKWPYDFYWKFRNEFGDASNFRIILHNGKYNLMHWLNPYSDNWQQALQRYFLLFLLLILLVLWLRTRKIECFGMLLALGALWVALVALYDVWQWRDYRTDAPVIFGILIWLLLKADLQERKIFGMVIAGYAICILPFQVNSYSSWTSEVERYSEVESLEIDWEELLGNNGEPCTLGMYKTNNWDYAFIKSLPPEVGYSIIGDEVQIATLKTADYIVTDVQKEKMPENYEWVTDLNDKQQLWKKSYDEKEVKTNDRF